MISKILEGKTMATESTESTENLSKENDAENKQNKSTGEAKSKILTASGDPGVTPGSAEGDEETVDEDIREKEAEGKL
jgi:hypothetical protein